MNKNLIVILIFSLLLLFSFEKELQNDEITVLTDETFDSFLNEYSQYTHFVILYRSTCGRCQNARKEIRKIFEPKHFDIEKIRFSEIELLQNVRTKFRFNIVDTPVLILIQKNKYIQLEEFPNETNIIKFLKSKFENPKDLPNKISDFFYFYKFFIDKSNSFIDKINVFLKNNGFVIFKVEPIMLYAIIIIFILFIFCIYRVNTKTEKHKKKIKKNE